MMAFKELADNMEQLFGVKCHFQLDEPVLIEDNLVATHLYHVAQEAANNSVKHGKANEIIIALALSNDEIVLSIQDDGVGIPEKLSTTDGMGMRIMKYRAESIGATLDIQRRKKGGTTVTCRLRQPTEGKNQK